MTEDCRLNNILSGIIAYIIHPRRPIFACGVSLSY